MNRNGTGSAFKFNPSASVYVPSGTADAAYAANANSEANTFNPDLYFMGLKMTSGYGFKPAKDLIENAVAIDCEMVGIGEPDYRGRYETTLAHVAIVNFRGKKILDTYVIPKEGIDAVTEYFTDISGVTRAKLEALLSPPERKRAHTFNVVLEKVKRKLDGKMIVGHQLASDFKVLDNYSAPDSKVWDSAILDIYRKNVPGWGRGARKLKEISKNFANNNIQVEGHPHSPLEDAKASMNLYRVYFGYDKNPI